MATYDDGYTMELELVEDESTATVFGAELSFSHWRLTWVDLNRCERGEIEIHPACDVLRTLTQDPLGALLRGELSVVTG